MSFYRDYNEGYILHWNENSKCFAKFPDNNNYKKIKENIDYCFIKISFELNWHDKIDNIQTISDAKDVPEWFNPEEFDDIDYWLNQIRDDIFELDEWEFQHINFNQIKWVPTFKEFEKAHYEINKNIHSED